MSIVKFSVHSDVNGYGFDLAADRVVRFNKHPDGTYLNTRSTYSINQKQFTHFELRKLALQSQASDTPTKTRKWLKIAFIILIGLILLRSCELNFTFDLTSDSASETK